jgi:hypothetical protein
MACYAIQFQNGLSLREFLAAYGTEERCVEAVCKARWPQGFVCSECGSAHHRQHHSTGSGVQGDPGAEAIGFHIGCGFRAASSTYLSKRLHT